MVDGPRSASVPLPVSASGAAPDRSRGGGASHRPTEAPRSALRTGEAPEPRASDDRRSDRERRRGAVRGSAPSSAFTRARRETLASGEGTPGALFVVRRRLGLRRLAARVGARARFLAGRRGPGLDFRRSRSRSALEKARSRPLSRVHVNGTWPRATKKKRALHQSRAWSVPFRCHESTVPSVRGPIRGRRLISRVLASVWWETGMARALPSKPRG